MKTNPNDSAQPVINTIVAENQANGLPFNKTFSKGGLTKLEHFASLATDDFESLPMSLKEKIIEEPEPRFILEDKMSGTWESHPKYDLEYVNWLAKGRARWKVIQAISLIEQLNDYHTSGL